MDYEYICMDCLRGFNSKPPFHDEPKNCPFSNCGSHDVCTMEIYDRHQQINAADEAAEEMRLIRERKKR